MVAVGPHGVDAQILRAAAELQLHARLKLQVVFQRVRVVEGHATAGAGVALLGAAQQAVHRRVGVGEGLRADAMLVPGVAVEAE